VLVDDWGWNDVGFRSTYLDWATPNIDRLKEKGLSLENYYTAYYCIPARASLMTGRYAFRQGMWDPDTDAELPAAESTIAEELQAEGYKTYMVGKWHLGLSSTSLWPLARGFDEYYGCEAGHRVHSLHARKC
jgi:arylsulfatase A-like enzyme